MRSATLLSCLMLLTALPRIGEAAPVTTWPKTEVADLGPVFRGADPGVLGFDGAYSLTLGASRSLWVFGDTFLGTWRPDGSRDITGFPSNTAAVVDDGDWPSGFSRARFHGEKSPQPVLTPLDSRDRVWPLDMVRVGGQDALYFVEIRPQGHGALDFKVVACGVATRKAGSSGAFETKTSLWSEGLPSYGTSVLRWGDELFVYAGGARTYLARVSVGDFANARRYRYWAGDRWVEHPHQAKPLPASGPEMSVRYNPYLHSFLMIDVPVLGRTVEARLAQHPWGPWSEPRTLLNCIPADVPGVMFYGAKQHVELDREGGRQIVLTYNTNAPEPLLQSRPDLYWPRLVRVIFSR